MHNEGMMKTTMEDVVKVETDCQQCASGTVELLVGFRRGPTIRSKVSNTLLQLIQSVSSSAVADYPLGRIGSCLRPGIVRGPGPFVVNFFILS